MERATWKNLVIFPIGYQWSPGNLASETTRRRTRRTVKQRLHGSMNDSCLLLYRHERVITRVLPTERSSGACGIKLCHCFMETFLGKTVSRKAAFQDRFIPFREREKSPSSFPNFKYESPKKISFDYLNASNESIRERKNI